MGDGEKGFKDTRADLGLWWDFGKVWNGTDTSGGSSGNGNWSRSDGVEEGSVVFTLLPRAVGLLD